MADHDQQQQLFKKVRKGTRSCQECRRRKKHCLWPEDNSNICTECAARGVPCLKQQVSSSKRTPASRAVPQDLQVRVSQLENALKALNASGDGLSRLSSGQSHASSISSPSSSQTTNLRLEHDLEAGAPLRGEPLVTDENSTLQLDTTCHKHVSPGFDALSRKKSRLQAAFPPMKLIELSLEADSLAWAGWTQQFPPLLGVTQSYPILQLVKDGMQGPSIANIGRALLVVIISLQETSSLSAYQNNLTDEDRQALINHGSQVIAEEVLSSDELCATLEGLECWLLQAKFDSNAGRIKKCWLDSRKSIALAQLCGFHRIPPPEPGDIVTGRKRSVWKCLYTVDRWTSLLAALPSCLNDAVATGWDMLADAPSEQSYFLSLGIIVGRIVDRNQEPPGRSTLSKTLQIDGEFMELAATRDANWWDISDSESISPSNMTTRIIPQFWHYQARLLLHLPFMLQANHDRRFEYNRHVTLDSARKMIHIFRRLRPAQGYTSHLCKMLDFQVFTAAMVLVLNHHQCVHSGIPPYQNPDGDSDQELLLATTAIMQKARTEIDEIVLKEATRALDIFNKSWDNIILPTADGASPSKVFVPYFGTVILGPGGNITREHPHTSTPSQSPLYASPSPASQSDLPLPSNQPPLINPVVVSNNAPNTAPVLSSSGLSQPDDIGQDMYNLPHPPSQQLDLPDFDVPMQGDAWGFTSGNLGSMMDMDLTRDWDWFWQNTQIEGLAV